MKFEKELLRLVEEQNLCFLGSVTEEGYPMIRAMLRPIKVEENCLYLHTNTSSKKVKQFLSNPKACLYFYDAAIFTGITLIGEMQVLSLEQEKTDFWQDDYLIYYEKGGGLSDFTVLKFTSAHGEFYQNFTVTAF
ncbi:hypothetical protein IGI39_004084 [Enterococcus sp. AZ135]|uniref:pyridoxamine 5'-phosphate oxidase family protein n=1 Tax=unclassified Enterococcus TaxID=2608891 RepID=UPI003F208E34